MSIAHKTPGEVLDYGLDWSGWLGEIADTIASSAWDVPTGIDVAAQSNDETGTTVWLGGGSVGQTYVARNRVTTVGGRPAERSLRISVVEVRYQ